MSRWRFGRAFGYTFGRAAPCAAACVSGAALHRSFKPALCDHEIEAKKAPTFTELRKHMGAKAAEYSTEWKPGGMEGAVNTDKLPWIDLPQMPGCAMKPLRVSRETGAFTVIIKMRAGTTQPRHVLLGASDSFVISGSLSYEKGPLKGQPLGVGAWSYTPACVRMEGITASVDTEYLATFYGPVAFLGADGKITSLLTGADVADAAHRRGVTLVPQTLAEAMQDKPADYSGPTEPLLCSIVGAWDRVSKADVPVVTELANAHWVDTNSLPWLGGEIGMKLMRISAETGQVSMMVRQNGQAPPHFHLGASDFFITSGTIGYRAGPPEGYGPGTYMFEPAGARHEATQRITDDDLIYTANLYGPIQFDDGVGTPVTMVASWMTYLEAAKAGNSPLLSSTFPDDSSTFLASNPIQKEL